MGYVDVSQLVGQWASALNTFQLLPESGEPIICPAAFISQFGKLLSLVGEYAWQGV